LDWRPIGSRGGSLEDSDGVNTAALVDVNFVLGFGHPDYTIMFYQMIIDIEGYPAGNLSSSQLRADWDASHAYLEFKAGLNIPKTPLQISANWEIGREGYAFRSYVGAELTVKGKIFEKKTLDQKLQHNKKRKK
jgi:hypothetical protein